MRYLVIDIGGTFTKYAIMNEQGEFLSKGKVPTRKEDQEDFLNMIVDLFERQKELSEDSLNGIAISSAGVIDSKKGYMKNAGTLYCVNDLYICKELSARCMVPVSIENDAKCAALAELWKGSLADCNDAAVMILGTALGGAVIHDRKIIQGKNLMAGEFSYILVNSEDPMNPDMTAAMYCGVPALLKLTAKAKNVSPESVTGELVFDWVNSSDPVAQGVLREYTRRLAVQILNWQFIFNPERVAVGGGISVQPVLLKYIREELERLVEVYPYPVPVPEVINCNFYNDANLIGALYVLLQIL